MADDSDPKTLREVILEDYRGAVGYARDILKVLSSDGLLKKAANRVDVLNEAKQKMARSSRRFTDTVGTLENKHCEIEEALATEYADVMGEENHRPDRNKIEEELYQLAKKIKIKEGNFKKLENEKKILEFNKKCRKLQKQIVDVNFDLSSNKDSVKGYIRRPGGELLTFQFDLNQESLCDITEFLWDQV